MGEFADSLDYVSKAGVFSQTYALSLGVRVTKYLGIYFLYLAVVRPNFIEFADLPFFNVVSALLSAEGAASLPVPAFMSFGTYEAGGALALVLSGFEKAQSVATMLCIHILSQLVDYTLGCMGFVTFLFLGKAKEPKHSTSVKTPKKKLITASAVVLLMAGAAFLGLQFRNAKKLGAVAPPDQGQHSEAKDSEMQRLQNLTNSLQGYMVWSSNRFGNHDILMRALPDLKIIRLTHHPHVDYFPRISPDGHWIVFSRSQQPWVSQRNYLPWDVYLLNVSTGKERLLAKNGNTPTWSEDVRHVYFQRNGNQFVVHDLATGREKVLFGPGTAGLIDSVMLETPSFSVKRQSMAATMRQGFRGTAVFPISGQNRMVGEGCQLAWAPDSSYLFYTDHGGRMQNAFFKVDPVSYQRTIWLDLPGDFSHEYFPKVSNDKRYLVLGASTGGHAHDTADYEIFIWEIDSPAEEAVRATFHSGNDCWPDIYLR